MRDVMYVPYVELHLLFCTSSYCDSNATIEAIIVTSVRINTSHSFVSHRDQLVLFRTQPDFPTSILSQCCSTITLIISWISVTHQKLHKLRPSRRSTQIQAKYPHKLSHPPYVTLLRPRTQATYLGFDGQACLAVPC